MPADRHRSLKASMDAAQASIRERNPDLGDPPLCACGEECHAIQAVGPAFWTGRCADCIKTAVTPLLTQESAQKWLTAYEWRIWVGDVPAAEAVDHLLYVIARLREDRSA
jgi:hypothetical protein